MVLSSVDKTAPIVYNVVMKREIDRILEAKDNASFLEDVRRLVEADDVKIVCAYVRDKPDGSYERQTMVLGNARGYEWMGILEEAKQGMLDIIYKDDEEGEEET